ncbi:Kv channel-interacting protein 4 isoform X2 [Drosophila busckii]|uniref:Kv channel-interacting protein 4 isoform X2 n=1 Tax=Drosophila busckii TaxID=30019 RepID=UPI00083ED801|nr:Kv channel-interacting protein 4 isoform X2 [Drosophila busckii]
MATAQQETFEIELPAAAAATDANSNLNAAQRSVNVITIISNNNNNSNYSNNNNNNNNNNNAGAATNEAATSSVQQNFVAIPLLERRRRSRCHSITPLAPIICIQSGSGNTVACSLNNPSEELTQLDSRSVSCFLRLRRCCAKFFGKIMGSNNPSEADRFDYYDYSELEEFETPARYRPDSLSALSRATRFSEDEIKRIYRGFKAECPTGVVKEDTFKVIYSQFFPQGANPTLYAHYVFNTLDQDHSGIVSFEDFVQGLSILSRGSVEEKLRWTFSLYDINGDGFITREEMTDIVTAIYELMGRLPDECPEEEKIKGKVEHIFQKMDINRDGVVTMEEFLEACRNDEAISRSMSVFESAF